MKYSTFASVVLATSAAAVPHQRHERHQHQARQWGRPTVTTTTAVSVGSAVVIVDQYGNPVTTSIQGAAAPTATDTYVAQDAVVEDPAPYSSSSSSSSAAAAQTSSTSSDSGDGTAPETSGYAVGYAPYNADDSCKTADQVMSDLNALNGHSMVRIYGAACDQLVNVREAAKANDMQVFLGIEFPENAAAEAQGIIDVFQNDWAMVHTVSVGNEVTQGDPSMVSTIADAINTARDTLSGGNYDGPVVGVDVFSFLLQDDFKPIGEASSYIAANCHAFFDDYQTGASAGKYVSDIADQLADFYGKDVVITESGWPSAGDTHGDAVPSPEEQTAAIDSLKTAFSGNQGGVILFSAFNDAWKEDFDGSWNSEKFWGIYGDAPSAAY